MPYTHNTLCHLFVLFSNWLCIVDCKQMNVENAEQVKDESYA